MPRLDGAYADAEFHDDRCDGAIGIVLVRNGEIVARDGQYFSTLTGNNAAEEMSIRIARQKYPTAPVFNDNTGAARRMGAVWIPREQNREAHHEAKLAYKAAVSRGEQLVERTAAHTAPAKRKKFLHFRGRGVIRGRGVVPTSR